MDSKNGPLLNKYYIEQNECYDTLNIIDKCFNKNYVENNPKIWRLVRNFKKELTDKWNKNINSNGEIMGK